MPHYYFKIRINRTVNAMHFKERNVNDCNSTFLLIKVAITRVGNKNTPMTIGINKFS